MNNQDLVPLASTNRKDKIVPAYIIASFFAVVMVMIGLLTALLHSDWWMLFIFILVASLLWIFMYVFYRTEAKNTYRYELRSDGLFQQWVSAQNDEATETFMSFSEMDLVLVGMYEDRIPLPKGGRMYRYHALLVLRYEEEYFFKKFTDATELNQWTNRLEENVSSLQYTSLNLSKAFLARHYTDVDFTEIPGIKRDVVRDFIGVETYTSLLECWEPEGMHEEVLASRRKQTIPRTRKAENRTMWILFIYNFLFALLVFPTVSVDKGGIMKLTDTILIGYMMINVLIPVVLVFWRSFTRRYLPLLFTIVTLTSNILGVIAALWIQHFSFTFVSLIILHAFTIVCWTVAMMNIKMFKLIRIFLREWEFGQ